MQHDSFIDPLTFEFREPPLRGLNDYSLIGGGHYLPEDAHPYVQSVRNGTSHGAHYFVIQNATMAEKIKYTSNGTTVMAILHP